jgi:hypothetical protein
MGLRHSPHHPRCGYPHQPERRLVWDIAFRVPAADNQPNFRTISDFRQDPFEDDGAPFEQVLRLATLLAAAHLIYRRKIELIDHVADDIRQTILRQPLPAGSAAAANHMSEKSANWTLGGRGP